MSWGCGIEIGHGSLSFQPYLSDEKERKIYFLVKKTGERCGVKFFLYGVKWMKFKDECRHGYGFGWLVLLVVVWFFCIDKGEKNTLSVVLGRRKHRETHREKLRRKEMCKVLTLHANTCGSLIIEWFTYSGMMCNLRNICSVRHGNEAWWRWF